MYHFLQIRNLLHGNYEVRAELQKERMTSLLPPIGVEVFRRFTPASLEKIQLQQEDEKKKQVKTFSCQFKQISPQIMVPTQLLCLICSRNQKRTKPNQAVTWRLRDPFLLFTGTCPQNFAEPLWRIWIPSMKLRRLVSLFVSASKILLKKIQILIKLSRSFWI